MPPRRRPGSRAFPRRRCVRFRSATGLRWTSTRSEPLIRRDRELGKQPFCVVATAGTTNTGAVDPLDEIAEVASADELWLHVDAADGGFFILTERGRDLLAGIEHADSLVLDPHKSLFLPFGTGALIVRDGELLRRAHSVEQPAYLQDDDDHGLPNFSDYGPELTRNVRGLRIWLPPQLHGVAAFRSALEEKLELASPAYDELRADPHFDLLAPPTLSIVAYRMRGRDQAWVDAALAEVLRRANDERRVLLSSTTIDGRRTEQGADRHPVSARGMARVWPSAERIEHLAPHSRRALSRLELPFAGRLRTESAAGIASFVSDCSFGGRTSGCSARCTHRCCPGRPTRTSLPSLTKRPSWRSMPASSPGLRKVWTLVMRSSQ